ncbi:hypothetical protein BDN72DRAFT_64469 [Pluteus cervinus]|uniref:Uncharacterized protein n=1 Tax=Pluteus cervinus TaxID=181527 RepID=A0ACD3AQU2_9AGAR|nr:hypothetical protein BDN72DRAFT_64469 [Pluteus cervinus]
MVSVSPRTALIAGLLLVEPAYLLTSSTANFMKKHVQRTIAFCAYKLRCTWRDIWGEKGLSAVPEELLVDIVKALEWRDILHIRQTSRRLNSISRSTSVWRSVVESVPPRLLWLERPIKTYSSQELERLFLRRQRAIAGYEALTNGATPRWRTIKVKDPPERKTMDVVPGGRWLLVPNARGSILYYDLDAHDSPAHVLIPKKPANCLTKMSIDVDSTCSYLRFNLALVFYFLRQPDYRIEVWQVDLVLDELGQGIGLRADRQASFKQEPPGLCDTLSLLGDNLAFTVFYKAHLAVYTVLVDWRSAKGSHYSKRILYPSSRHSACLLPGNVLMSATSNSIMLVP